MSATQSPLITKAAALKSLARAQDTEIVTESEMTAADLRSIAEEIEDKIEIIAKHEQSFEEGTLEFRLEIGHQIAKAMELFTLANDQRQGIGGRPSETLSQCDTVSAKASVSQCDTLQPEPIPAGFNAWLTSSIPRLKRPTAYKYASAFRSLGLSTDDATPARIRTRIKDLRHVAGKSGLPMPTLSGLARQAPKLPKPEDTALVIVPPPDSAQLRLEDAREGFHLWKERFEIMIRAGQLDDLDRAGVESLKEFLAGARDRINARLK